MSEKAEKRVFSHLPCRYLYAKRLFPYAQKSWHITGGTSPDVRVFPL